MSWTALVTHRWPEGIIDVVQGHLVDADGTLTASYLDNDTGRMSFPQGEWHQSNELAIAAASRHRDDRIESLRGQVAELQQQIELLQKLEFAIDRDGPQPD